MAPRGVVSLTTRNLSGTIARVYSADRQIKRAVKEAVRRGEALERQIVETLVPIDTSFMHDHIRSEFSRDGLAYELGWWEDDFTAAGLPFYPIFVEFGTVKMQAQPSLFPAREIARREIVDEIRDAIREAARRAAVVRTTTTRRRY